MTTNGHEPISKDLISNFVSKTPNFTPGYSKFHTTSSPFDDADINFPSELLKKFTSRYFFLRKMKNLEDRYPKEK